MIRLFLISTCVILLTANIFVRTRSPENAEVYFISPVDNADAKVYNYTYKLFLYVDDM